MFNVGDKVTFKKPYGKRYFGEEFTVKTVTRNAYFKGGGHITTYEYPSSIFAIGALEYSTVNLENE